MGTCRFDCLLHSCAGEAEYCQAALAEVKAEFYLEFYLLLLAGCALGVAVFLTGLAGAILARKARLI
jgi:hypothetical protein